MIEIKVFGGLGNQMFQYAMYRYLSINNMNVYLNISDYKVHNHHQGFELTKVFGIDGPFIETESKNAVKSNSILIRTLQKVLQAKIVGTKEYYENKEISFIEQEEIHSDIYIVGFWQDARYIDPVEELIRKDFVFKKELSIKNQLFIRTLSKENTISVHVRRGDYIENNGLFGICDENYYFRAISYMKEHVEKPKFIFFSDDIAWCKEKYVAYNAEFIDWNTGSDSCADMYLMSLCKHHIIANSTFSWWGAYLNQNANKIVVCPKQWSLKTIKNRLAFSSWVQI